MSVCSGCEGKSGGWGVQLQLNIDHLTVVTNSFFVLFCFLFFYIRILKPVYAQALATVLRHPPVESSVARLKELQDLPGNQVSEKCTHQSVAVVSPRPRCAPLF